MKTPLSETPRKSRREISLSFFRREFRSIMQHPASAIHPSLRPSSDAPSSGNAIVALFSRNFPRCFSVSPLPFLSSNAECREGGKRHITGNCGHPTDAASLPHSLSPSFPPTLPFHFPPNVMDGVHHSGSGARCAPLSLSLACRWLSLIATSTGITVM